VKKFSREFTAERNVFAVRQPCCLRAICWITTDFVNKSPTTLHADSVIRGRRL